MGGKWVYDRSSLLDFVGFLIVYAPDFPVEDFLSANEQLTVDSAFEELMDGFRFVGAGRERQIASLVTLANESLDCFHQGDIRRGKLLLQKIDVELEEGKGQKGKEEKDRHNP